MTKSNDDLKQQFLKQELPKWHLVWRGIASATNKRTLILSVIPGEVATAGPTSHINVDVKSIDNHILHELSIETTKAIKAMK